LNGWRGAHVGFALPLALVVIIIGLVLSGLIFDSGYSFFSTAMNQESLYVDHVAATDYVEAAKGWLIRRNIDSPAGVMHGVGRSTSSAEITSLNDLMLDDPPGTPLEERYLSFDREAPYQRGGINRVVVNVFDAHYRKENISKKLLDDPAQMRLLPPPINAVGVEVSAGDEASDEGEATAGDVGTSDAAADGYYPWTSYGAYVVRVQLYDVDKDGNYILKRATDEAFFQVLSGDAPGP
jgi:hypothetical protein